MLVNIYKWKPRRVSLIEASTELSAGLADQKN